MRSIIFAATLSLLMTPVFGQGAELTGPKEVGSTSMPPGQYLVTEQISHKSYSLTVTDKGNMILAPAPHGATASSHAAPAAAATPATSATATASPAAGATATGADASKTATNSAIKGLMQKGMQKGMQELMRPGTTKTIQKLLK